MRDWSAILIDAGIRGLNVASLAREQKTSPSNVTAQTKRYGIRLIGQSETCRSTDPAKGVSRTLRDQDWPKEFATAKAGRETLNQFVARVGCCASTATRKAQDHSHTFQSRESRKLLWWRRQLALAEAGSETLTAFCRRTGKGSDAAQRWASRLSHTFAASKATAHGRKAAATRLANTQAQA